MRGPFLGLLAVAHRRRDADATAPEDVEDDTSLGLLCAPERLGGRAVLQQEREELVVRRHVALESALLIGFAAGHVQAQPFDRGDRVGE